MAAQTLYGKRITLRSPIESDKADRLAAGRDPEVRRGYGADYRVNPPLTEGEVESWFAETAGDLYRWVIDLDGRCIGTAFLHGFDQSNRRARFAIGLLSSRDFSQGYGTEATRMVLKFAFETLRLHRVDLNVLAFNQRAIRCYEKCGFIVEGIERETLFVADEWQSDVMMSILEHEYRAMAPAWEI